MKTTPPPARLFIPDDEPCTKCKGRGKTGPAYDEQRCPACQGTGQQKNVYDPSRAEVPF